MFKLIAGLGNPGTKYQGTRHNAGFMAADLLRAKWQTISCTSKFAADICETSPVDSSPLVGEARRGVSKVFILKPETFMNNSGVPVGEFARFYKIEPKEVLVIYDDLDLPVGHLRLSEGGTSGGHNGVQSIIENFGKDFYRLRLGIGDNRAAGLPSEAYVLQKFKPEELELIKKSTEKSVEIIELLLSEKLPDAQTQIAEFNRSLM